VKFKKQQIMIIERTSNEFIIRFPISAETKSIQDIIDYLRYKELTAGYSVVQPEVDKLAREINKNWWGENKAKFI
jgi:hypothetical protein